ncbi:MAG TPA: metallophosphoesterase [Bryobacteraceae bacterium]
MTPQPAGGTGRRPLTHLVGMKRSATQAFGRLAQENAPADRPPIQDFDTTDVWPWITNWIKATFHTDVTQRHPFNTYPATGEQGHYDLSGLLAPDGSIRIALAGDWGTGTDVAQQVADSMGSVNPELTIHLGDVYYVGLENEVEQNCLGMNSGSYQGVTWKWGTKGSLALNGNHEMYSGGFAYFDDFLPKLGIPTSQDKQQLASYFCLETPVWRILAVDTGYNSDVAGGNCSLEQANLDWLKNVINPAGNRKPTVLLSHHQWFSGFGDGDYDKPADQIAPFLQNQEIVWLWGHEHRLAIYYKYKGPDNHLTAYGRCLGHGGMPIEMPATDPTEDPAKHTEYWDGAIAQYPNRFQTLPDKTVIGTNGYAQMVIQGPTLTLEYLDADGTSVLKESFVPGGGAAWDGTLVRTVLNDPQILNKIEWAD